MEFISIQRRKGRTYLLPVSINLEAFKSPWDNKSRKTSWMMTEPMKAKRDALPAGAEPLQESLEQYGTYLFGSNTKKLDKNMMRTVTINSN
jgi:hypothetical protein